MADKRGRNKAHSKRHQLRQPERLEDRLVMDGAGFVNTEPPEDPDSIVGAAGIVANDDYESYPSGSQSIRISPLKNDELPDGASGLTIKSVSDTANGASVTISDDGQHLIYTASGDDGLQSSDSFYYIVQTEDGRLGKANVQLGTKQRDHYYRPPLYSRDRFTVLEDSGETIFDVLRNDNLLDPVIESVSMPTLGSKVQISGDGKLLLYTPKYGVSGRDYFTYTARGADGELADFSVRVDISKPYQIVNHYRDTDGALLDFGAGALQLDPLANDTFVGPSSVVPVIESFSIPEYAGELTLSEDGRSFRYEPNEAFLGTFSISYTVRYGEADHQTTSGSFTVSVQQHALAVEDWFAVDPNQSGPTTLDVLANDPVISPFRYAGNAHYLPAATTDVQLTIVGVSSGSDGGKIAIDSSKNQLEYTPAEGFLGEEIFSYTMMDSTGVERTASLTVRVAEPVESVGAGQFATRGELEQYLIDRAVQRYVRQFGAAQTRYGPYEIDDVTPVVHFADVGISDAALRANGVAESDSYSETNTQVDGVDEADIVETDGRYVYTFTDGQLAIVDMVDPANPVLVSLTSFESKFDKMYLQGDRITLLRNGQQYWYHASQERSAEVVVLDIADRSAPSVVERTEIDGHIVDSRAIGGRVHLVVHRNFVLPELEGRWLVEPTPPEQGEPNSAPLEAGDSIISIGFSWYDRGEPGVWQNETLDEYLTRVREQLIDTALPSYRAYDANGELVASGLLSKATSVHRPIGSEDVIVSVVTLDASDDQAGPVAEATTFVADSSTTTYVSTTAAYIFAYDHSSDTTTIYKMGLEEDGTSPVVATGQIRGRLLNQFSADEFDGYLRVATTQQDRELGENGRWRQSRLTNNLLVLEQQGDSLLQVGAVNNMAPTETVFSVRFMGDRAFVVTFRVVDPLFAIDLSDPTAPTVEGALKIPGFSNYLHPVGSDYLIGIGRDADEITGRRGPFQITLFDVSDLSDPQVADQLTFEDNRWAWSEAQFDHHAVSFFADQGVLALPINWSESTENNGVKRHSAIATVAANVDGEASLTSTGFVEHEASGGYVSPFLPMWQFRTVIQVGHSQQSSPARRALRIGESLVTISDYWVKVHELDKPENQVGELYLGPPARDDQFELDEDSGTTTLDVLANDYPGSGGELLPVSSVEQPTMGGTVTVSEDGSSLSFTPDENFNGYVQFSYTVLDPTRGEQSASVAVYIHPVDDAPIANDDEFVVGINSGAIQLDVLGNDGNPDLRYWNGLYNLSLVHVARDDVAPYSNWDRDLEIVDADKPSAGGTVEINEQGELFYTPANEFVGIETFEYTVTNVSGLTATATVTVYVGVTPVDEGETDAAAEQSSVMQGPIAEPGLAELDLPGVLNEPNVATTTDVPTAEAAERSTSTQPIDAAVASLFGRGGVRRLRHARFVAATTEPVATPTHSTSLWTDVVDQVHDGEEDRSSIVRGNRSERLAGAEGVDLSSGSLRDAMIASSVRRRFR